MKALVSLLFLASVVLTGCSSEVRALGDVGVDSGTAKCLLEETKGVMEPDRLTDIVGERTTYSQAEADLVTRAFISCVG